MGQRLNGMKVHIKKNAPNWWIAFMDDGRPPEEVAADVEAILGENGVKPFKKDEKWLGKEDTPDYLWTEFWFYHEGDAVEWFRREGAVVK